MRCIHTAKTLQRPGLERGWLYWVKPELGRAKNTPTPFFLFFSSFFFFKKKISTLLSKGLQSPDLIFWWNLNRCAVIFGQTISIMNILGFPGAECLLISSQRSNPLQCGQCNICESPGTRRVHSMGIPAPWKSLILSATITCSELTLWTLCCEATVA